MKKSCQKKSQKKSSFFAKNLHFVLENFPKIFIENVRPQVHSITVTGKTAEDFNILTELGTKPRVLRPTDLLRAINPELRTKNVLRKEQIILQEDERFEPLSIRLLPATPVEVLA